MSSPGPGAATCTCLFAAIDADTATSPWLRGATSLAASIWRRSNVSCLGSASRIRSTRCSVVAAHRPIFHHATCRAVAQLLTNWFPLAADGEFSVEANPEDIEPVRVSILQDAGVNRVSLGVQSFDAGKLTGLERAHREIDVRRRCDV